MHRDAARLNDQLVYRRRIRQQNGTLFPAKRGLDRLLHAKRSAERFRMFCYTEDSARRPWPGAPEWRTVLPKSAAL